MGFKYKKWLKFPLVVNYGTSNMVLHLDRTSMNYCTGLGEYKISAKVYLKKPELFTRMNNKIHRQKVTMNQGRVIIDWCIGEQPEIKK